MGTAPSLMLWATSQDCLRISPIKGELHRAGCGSVLTMVTQNNPPIKGYCTPQASLGLLRADPDHPQIKGNYTLCWWGCVSAFNLDHPKINGNFTLLHECWLLCQAPYHPQMKGNFTRLLLCWLLNRFALYHPQLKGNCNSAPASLLLC